MATHHSKTGRAKSPNDKIVVPSWDEMWDSFKEENTKTTIEAMNAEGWKTLEQAADESGLGRTTIRHMVKAGKMEQIKAKVFFVGAVRNMNFVRPKV